MYHQNSPQHQNLNLKEKYGKFHLVAAIHPNLLLFVSIGLIVILYSLGIYRYFEEITPASIPTPYISNMGDGKYGKYIWGAILPMYIIFLTIIIGPPLLLRRYRKEPGMIVIFSILGMGLIITAITAAFFPNSANHDVHIRVSLALAFFAFVIIFLDTIVKPTLAKRIFAFFILVTALYHIIQFALDECEASKHPELIWLCAGSEQIAVILAILYPNTLREELYGIYRAGAYAIQQHKEIQVNVYKI